MSDDPLKRRSGQNRSRGDLYFASFFLAAALLLLSRIGTETSWVEGAQFFSQPRFWPAVSLLGMTSFALAYFLGSVCSGRDKEDFREVILWLRSIEYALWFMAYVLAVPLFGYLFCTVIFACALSWRAGYRDKRTFMIAGAISVIIVTIFKGLLSVKIPGGQLYEYFPDAMRSFMILYL